MRAVIILAALFLASPAVAQPPPPGPPPCETAESPEVSLPWDLTFIADEGIRVDRAALPKPFVDEAGRVHLFYQTGNGPGTTRNYYATSDDGLTFDNARLERPADIAFHPFRRRMPNGVWRMFSFDPRTGEMRSRSAGDGVNFGDDPGVRYRLTAEDRGSSGIHDEYVDREGRVIMLYLGDLMGLNNIRRAVSTDNGWTFAFDRGDVLGDSEAARTKGPANAFVDQKTLTLPDGSQRLFAMRLGCAIYSFRESEDGTFSQETGARVTVSSWPGLAIRSLHDPVVVRLPDGRYRMYVCAGLHVPAGEPVHEVILTATTAAPPDIQ